MNITFNDLRECILEQASLTRRLTEMITAVCPELPDFEVGPVAVPGDSLGEMLCGAYLICDTPPYTFSWEVGFLGWGAETIRFLNLELDFVHDETLKQRVLQQIEQDLRRLGFTCLLQVDHYYRNTALEAVCSGWASREVIDVMCRAMRLCLPERAMGEI